MLDADSTKVISELNAFPNACDCVLNQNVRLFTAGSYKGN